MPILSVITFPASGHLDVGDLWRLQVEVIDDTTGQPTSATVAAAVNKPDGSAATPPTVLNPKTGSYLADYTLADAGRHTAKLTASGAVVGVEHFAIIADSPATTLPNLAAVKAYLGTVSYTDPEIQTALDAEIAAQDGACKVPAVYNNDLKEALFRRVARNLNLRNKPLAVLQGDSEAGTSLVLPGRDPEVRRLEARYRRLVVG